MTGVTIRHAPTGRVVVRKSGAPPITIRHTSNRVSVRLVGMRGPPGPSGGVSEAQATAIAESAATVSRFNPLALVEAMLNPGL